LNIELPASLAAERRGNVAIVKLARPQKRNALDDTTVLGLETFFTSLPDDIAAALLYGEGEHFSAGLDLSELQERDIAQGIAHSALWHRVFDKIQFGKVPVVTVLHGAVVGGGGSVRIPRLIGVARMMDMMLTGRTYSAEDGQAMGLTTYLVEPGEGFAKGFKLAQRIAGNTTLTNFAITHVLPRIAETDPASGYAVEALMSSIAQADPEAKTRLNAFLQGRANKVTRPK
jgi:enoyl-CoA hydratase/carnithine racemase